MAVEILFMQTITDASIKQLIEQCGQHKEITLLLHSCGGEIGAAYAFYNFIRLKKIKLTVNVISGCMSSAFVILAAGKKRLAAKDTRFVLHQVFKSFNQEFQMAALRGQVKDLEIMNDLFAKLIAKTSNLTPKQAATLLRNETVLTADEAFEKGFLTEKPY